VICPIPLSIDAEWLLTLTVVEKLAGALPHWEILTAPCGAVLAPGGSVTCNWQLGLTRAPEKVMLALVALASLDRTNETAHHANAANSLDAFFMLSS
jgi:hypothetical protein